MTYKYTKKTINCLLSDFKNLVAIAHLNNEQGMTDVEVLAILFENGRIGAIDELEDRRKEILKLKDQV